MNALYNSICCPLLDKSLSKLKFSTVIQLFCKLYTITLRLFLFSNVFSTRVKLWVYTFTGRGLCAQLVTRRTVALITSLGVQTRPAAAQQGVALALVDVCGTERDAVTHRLSEAEENVSKLHVSIIQSLLLYFTHNNNNNIFNYYY